jgi:hypothetical protein
MTVFKRALTTGTNDIKDSEAIGVVDGLAGVGDLGKFVVLAAASFTLAADGAQIEGQIDSFSGFTVNDGFQHGTVKKGHRLSACVVLANTAVVGAKVLAAPQVALGSIIVAADPYLNGKVKIDVSGKWRIYEVVGDASAADCKVILERAL